MKVLLAVISLVFLTQPLVAQESINKDVDSLYKEDQFYAGITYNLLGKRAKDLSQSNFSTGFHFGFIKDMPINKQRDVAIGIGIGYSANSFNQNLFINKNETGNITYDLLINTDTYTKNKFSMHMIELPIEFRWRTSTATEYKFWRIYTGFKLGYVITNTTKFKGDLGSFKNKNIADFNDFQYGLTLSVGYNTWNMHLYYALNSIFSEDALLDGQVMDMNAVKVGLMFYIL